MINELGRNILYFIEIALAKPFYAIVPALVALMVGAYFIYTPCLGAITPTRCC
jgi:hypothetical protein